MQIRLLATLSIPLVLAVSLSTALAADPARKPDQFRGIRWGAEVSSLSGLTLVDRDGDIIHYDRPGETKDLGGIPLRHVTYSFYKGQFYHADIGYEGENSFAAIQRSLEEKYGPPDAVREKTDAAGHAYEVAVWDWPGYVFIGNRHDKGSPRGRIFYFYAPLTDASAKSQGIAPAQTPASAPGKAATYLVKRGDSLSRIARQLGTTESALAAANPGLTDKTLKAGATIALPAGLTPPDKGPDKAEAASKPASPAVQAPAPGAYVEYTVKEGDVLSKVANGHGTRTRDVIAANPGINPDFLRPGTVLRIPVGAAAPKTETPQPAAPQTDTPKPETSKQEAPQPPAPPASAPEAGAATGTP
jgi:LysM repeat protein